jgi:hypothetical protein
MPFCSISHEQKFQSVVDGPKADLALSETYVSFPEGFSMRCTARLLRHSVVARVDKSRKEEAAGACIKLWGKSAGGRGDGSQ